MQQQDYHLGVPTLTGSEEGGVSVTVHCVHHCPMLHQQLDAVGVACEGGCMQGWGGNQREHSLWRDKCWC